MKNIRYNLETFEHPRHNRGIYHGDLVADAKIEKEYDPDIDIEAKKLKKIEKEEEMDQKQMIVATPFEIMDRLDDQQIAESMKGQIIDTFVYSYQDSSGKVVEGLSKAGVDESCKQLANKGEVIRELECLLEKEDDTYAYFKAKAGRFAISPDGKEVLLETKIGHKRQCKFIVGKGNKPDRERENSFWYEQGGQKCLRNCRRDLLSEKFIVELIKSWKGEGKHIKQIKDNGDFQPEQPKPQGDLTDTINFGKKHKGKSFEEVYQEDPGYFNWLLEKSDMFKNGKNPELRDKIELFLDSQRFKDEDLAE